MGWPECDSYPIRLTHTRKFGLDSWVGLLLPGLNSINSTKYHIFSRVCSRKFSNCIHVCNWSMKHWKLERFMHVLLLRFELTWTPSITQRSPASKGCTTKTKTMDSKRVFPVLWNKNPMSNSWVVIATKTLVLATSITRRMTIAIITLTTALASLCNCCTAVLVSFRAWASDFRSRYALTYTEEKYDLNTIMKYPDS